MPYNLLVPQEKRKFRRPPPWLWQWRWWIALGTLFILVWWLVPPLLYLHTGTTKDAKLKAVTDTRTALLAGLIGVGALLTFWLNSRVYRITAQTLRVTEQGHITERYTKAIEPLGNNQLTIRLGGLYALERIAWDSQRDQSTVVEVLSAFVREESKKQGDPTALTATDVQAVVTVLSRLPRLSGVSRGDLTGAHLLGADLRGANLQEATLEDADLEGANLQGADLEGANLRGANLQRADLEDTDLLGANMRGADLRGAYLWGADMQGAALRGADLRGVDLEGADLRRALATGKTMWPDGFDWRGAGVLMKGDE